MAGWRRVDVVGLHLRNGAVRGPGSVLPELAPEALEGVADVPPLEVGEEVPTRRRLVEDRRGGVRPPPVIGPRLGDPGAPFDLLEVVVPRRYPSPEDGPARTDPVDAEGEALARVRGGDGALGRP